jgi:hypothetical protein
LAGEQRREKREAQIGARFAGRVLLYVVYVDLSLALERERVSDIR